MVPWAWLISGVVHVGVLGAVGLSLDAEPAGGVRFDRAELSPAQDHTPLGIDESQAVTLTWLGFERPTEHEARQARVEQPELSLSPPAVVAEAAPAEPEEAEPVEQPSEPVDTAEPVEQAIERPAEQPADRAAEQPAEESAEPDPPSSPVLEPAEMLPLIPEFAAAVLPDAVVAVPMPATAQLVGPPAPPAIETQVAEAVQPASPAQPPARPPTQPAPQRQEQPNARPGDRPGIQSEQQSPATSLVSPVRIRMGQTVAREGLTIKTRDPRLSLPDRYTFTGRNPIVLIEFKRDGTIRHPISFVRRSGMASVDHDVELAVYSWSASGKLLDDLPPDPSPTRPSTVAVQMEIVLLR